MSWLSKKWDQLSGKNQKVGLGTVNREYDAAFQGARDAYGNLQDTGEQMMDADSQLNLNRKSQMEASAADASAEGARQAQRLAAMGGGGNTASLTAQTMESGNKAQAGAVGAFNQYLAGAMGQGAGLVSQSANNMAQMNQTQMNAVSNQRLANSRLDSQATGMGAQMLGSVLGNVVAPGIGGKIGKGIGQMFAQEGEYVEPDEQESELDQEWWDNRNKAAFKYNMRHYDRAKSGEKFMGMAKGSLGAGLLGTVTGWGGIALPLAGAAYGRYKAGKTFEESNEDQVSKADRDRWKQIQKDDLKRQRSGERYQDGGPVESPYGNSGGMLSQVMGPDGVPMQVRTRIGGQYVG